MTLIKWRDSFNTGLAGVDYEHRQLIDLINRVHDELEGSADRARLDLFFGELYTCISAHFALEEKFMRDNRYERYLEHKADHEHLLDDIRDLMDDDGTVAENLSGSLSDRLKAWFENHFSNMDRHLHQILGEGPG